MSDNDTAPPKTRKESKKDQDAKATGVYGGYTSKHVRVTSATVNEKRKGPKSNQHANKASRTGEINHEALDES